MRIRYAIASGLVLLTALGLFAPAAYAATSDPAPAPSATATAAPAPVTNVQWEYRSATQVDLFWSGTLDLTTQYRVNATMTSEGKKTSATYNVSDTHVTLKSIVPGAKLTATVTAYNTLGTAEPTDAPDYTQPPTAPGSPRSVKMAAKAYPKAQVSWQAPAFDGGTAVTSYTVSVFTASNKQVYWVNNVKAKETSVTVPMLQPGVRYYATVAAVNNYGTGPVTTSKTITSARTPVVTPSQPYPAPTVTKTIQVPSPTFSAPSTTPRPVKSTTPPVVQTKPSSIFTPNLWVIVLLVGGLAAAVTALVFVVHSDNKRLREERDRREGPQ